jgi:hypothetical protein
MDCVLLLNGIPTDISVRTALRFAAILQCGLSSFERSTQLIISGLPRETVYSASLPPSWTRGCSTNQYAEHPLTDATPSFPAGAEERRATITDRHSQMSFCVCLCALRLHLCGAGLLNTPFAAPTLLQRLESYYYRYSHFTAVLWRTQC